MPIKLLIIAILSAVVILSITVIYWVFLRRKSKPLKLKVEPSLKYHAKLTQTPVIKHRISTSQTISFEKESKSIQTPKYSSIEDATQTSLDLELGKSLKKPIQICVTQQLEQNSEINKKYAYEFIRGARTIENILRKHGDENYSHLSSFLVNDIPHFVDRLVSHKQLIQKALRQIENNEYGIEIEDDQELIKFPVEFEEDIIYQFTARTKKFEHDAVREFDKEHRAIMQEIMDEYNENDKEMITNLRVLYEDYVFKYCGRDKSLIESAIDLQKQRMVPSDTETEMESSVSSDSDFAELDTDQEEEKIDEITDVIVANQKEQEKIEKGWGAWKLFVYIAIPVLVIVTVVSVLYVKGVFGK